MAAQDRSLDGSFDYSAAEWHRIFETLDAGRMAPRARRKEQSLSRADARVWIRNEVLWSLMFARQPKALSEKERRLLLRASHGAGETLKALAELASFAPLTERRLAGLLERNDLADACLSARSRPGLGSRSAGRALEDIHRLLGWLVSVLALLDERETTAHGVRPRGRTPKTVAQALVEELVSIFEMYTGLKAGLRANRTKPGSPAEGPFLDFVKAVLQPLPPRTFSESPAKLVRVVLCTRRKRADERSDKDSLRGEPSASVLIPKPR